VIECAEFALVNVEPWRLRAERVQRGSQVPPTIMQWARPGIAGQFSSHTSPLTQLASTVQRPPVDVRASSLEGAGEPSVLSTGAAQATMPNEAKARTRKRWTLRMGLILQTDRRAEPAVS